MHTKMLCQITYNVNPEGALTNSLQGAIEDIHTLSQCGLNEDITVILDDGVYYIEEPLIINDIISPNHSITFIAKEGTHPVISGGQKLSLKRLDDPKIELGNKLLTARVDYDVRNLWINNVRMKRAQGFVGYATGVFEDFIDGTQIKGLLFPIENFPCFDDISGLEIKYYKNWRNYYFKVEAIYDNESIASLPENLVLVVIKNFDIALEVAPKMINVGPDNPYYFENSLDLTDEPGEWCYSPREKSIYYYPLENVNNIDAIAPRLQNLISVKSLSKEDKIQNLIFKGLQFSHTNWDWISENGFFPKQGSTFCTEGDGREMM